MCVCLCTCVGAIVHVWRPEENSEELFFSLYHVVSQELSLYAWWQMTLATEPWFPPLIFIWLDTVEKGAKALSPESGFQNVEAHIDQWRKQERKTKQELRMDLSLWFTEESSLLYSAGLRREGHAASLMIPNQDDKSGWQIRMTVRCRFPVSDGQGLKGFLRIH